MTFDARKFWTDPMSYETPRGDLKHICKPEFFIPLNRVTEMVVNTLSKYLNKDASIIELGCNCGRNLAGLKAAGFTNLLGVEINPQAIELGRRTFPLLEGIEIRNAAIEDVINDLPRADCYFTQGVLMHLPPESEWVFKVISDKARKFIMVSEREKMLDNGITWLRDYSKIFALPVWKQLEVEMCGKYVQLPNTTIKRVFEKVIPDDEDQDPRPSAEVEQVSRSPKKPRSRTRL